MHQVCKLRTGRDTYAGRAAARRTRQKICVLGEFSRDQPRFMPTGRRSDPI